MRGPKITSPATGRRLAPVRRIIVDVDPVDAGAVILTDFVPLWALVPSMLAEPFGAATTQGAEGGPFAA